MSENSSIQNQSFVKKFLTGQLSRTFLLTRIFPVLILSYIFLILVANLTFPGPYDWRYMVISSLGSPEDNPHGYYYMSIGGVIISILMIPMIGFVHKRLSLICRGSTSFGTFFAILGELGLFLMSVLVKSTILGDRTHENLAIVAFAGLLFALFFWGFPLIKDRMPRYHGRKQFNWTWMKVAFIMMWGIILGTGIGLGLNELLFADIEGLGYVGIDWIDPYHPEFVQRMPWWASFAFWEWCLFVGLLAYFVMLTAIIPEQVLPLEK